ncbi:unnamed protein product [Linum tenue]|uniref:Uncharacterized protein n=1 Tax=Linum tenue TaxID=586396 RepID=A0AAV0Q971_9ROSI|nr:unnamed protein product [Linum tenue]
MTASTSRKPSKQKNVGGATNTNTDSQQIPVEEVHVSEKDSSAGDAPVEVEGAAARPGSTTKKKSKTKKKGNEVKSCVLDSIHKVQCPGRLQDVKVYEVWEGV